MVAVAFNKQSDVTDVAVFGDTASIDLWYPRREGRVRFIKVGLMDVRASDGIRIHYDFERDGFVIEQPKPLLRKLDERTYDQSEEWIEVAFCPSRQFGYDTPDGQPTEADWAQADAEYEAAKSQSPPIIRG